MAKSTPGKITGEIAQQVRVAFRAGADWHLAAHLAKVSRQALEQYQERHPDIKQQWADARAEADGRIVKCLYDKAKTGDLGAICFWLKNRRPDEWRERREIVGDKGNPVAITLQWIEDNDGSD